MIWATRSSLLTVLKRLPNPATSPNRSSCSCTTHFPRAGVIVNTAPSSSGADILEISNRVCELVAFGLAESSDDEHAVGIGRQNRGIRDRQQRGRIHDDIVEAPHAIRSGPSVAANDPSSSLGFGGTAPEVRTVNPGKRVFCSTSSRDARPLSTVLNPTDPTKSRYLSNLGRRISPSTSTTLCSASANASAMFIAVVDLPSPGIELVTTITRGGLSTSRNCKLVRKFAKCFSNCRADR